MAIGWEPLPPCSYSLKMGKLIYMANERYPFLVDYYNEVYKEQFVAREVIPQVQRRSQIESRR